MGNIRRVPTQWVTVALTMLVYSSPATWATPSLHTREEWQAVWPTGCEQSDNLWEAVVCLRQDSCLDTDTPQELYTCFRNEFQDSGWQNHTMRDIFDTALYCLDPYYQCWADRMAAAVEALPPCVTDSITAMGQCFLEHVGECWTSCASEIWTSPYADQLNVFDLFSCAGIEDALLQPVCDVVDCCLPCVTHLETLAECVVNDVLDFGFLDFNCDFTCDTTPPERRYARQEDDKSAPSVPTTATAAASEQVAAQHVYERCLTMTPGLLHNNDARTELVTRSTFFDCLVQETLHIFETSTTTTTSTTPAVTTAAAEEKDDGSVEGAEPDNPLSPSAQLVETNSVDSAPNSAASLLTTLGCLPFLPMLLVLP